MQVQHLITQHQLQSQEMAATSTIIITDFGLAWALFVCVLVFHKQIKELITNCWGNICFYATSIYISRKSLKKDYRNAKGFSGRYVSGTWARGPTSPGFLLSQIHCGQKGDTWSSWRFASASANEIEDAIYELEDFQASAFGITATTVSVHQHISGSISIWRISHPKTLERRFYHRDHFYSQSSHPTL